MTADEVKKLLAEKHSEDVFITECKDGPTHGGGHRRLDAWVMAKSWANPLVTGYEIKVSRSDFNKDDKWRTYLPLCNELYFVCPSGLIQPKEVDDPAGLMVVNPGGTRLYRKKKAMYRDVVVPESLYRYVLMSRANIDEEKPERRDGRDAAYWEWWLNQKNSFGYYGHGLSKRIDAKIKEEIFRVQNENNNLKRMNEEYAEIKDALLKAGVNPSDYYEVLSAKRRAMEFRKVIPANLKYDVDNAIRQLSSFRDTIEKLSGESNEDGH